MPYATMKEFFAATRAAAQAYPSERDRLSAFCDLARRDGLEAGVAAFADWQNTIAGSGKAESPQPVADGAATQDASPGVAPKAAQTHDDAPDSASHAAAAQSASGGITGQSTQLDEADAGALPTQPGFEGDVGADSTGLPSGASPSIPVYAVQPDSPTQPDTGQDAPEVTATQSTLPSEVQALSVAPESPMTHAEPAAGTLPPGAAQDASAGATAQNTLSGKADSQADDTQSPDFIDTLPGGVQAPSVTSESPVMRAEPAGDTSPTSASQNTPESATAQSTLFGKADSHTDDARARLLAQIDCCLELETDPALRLFLKQLARDAHKYPAEFVRQELDAYLQAANPDDFLNRLAALHWQWAQDDAAADTDGKRLTRGNTGERKTVLARIQANFEWESRPILRCYLAKLARQAITNPVKAAEGLEGYLDGRASPTWVWLAAVFVCGSPEAAFQWRLQEVRRKVADARLSGYLDTLEQTARGNLPAAATKLEAFTEIMGLQAASLPAAVA